MNGRNRSKFVRIMALLLVVAMLAGVAFYLVMLIGMSNMEGRVPGLVNRIGWVTYAETPEEADARAEKKATDLLEILRFIQANYKDNVTLMELVNGAYGGVFSTLDEWSVFYDTPDGAENFVSYLNTENYEGIGATLTTNNKNECYVTALNMYGPAKASGMKVGDIILKVDGRDTKGLSLDAITDMIRGKAGSVAKIVVKRGAQELTFNVTRASLKTTDIDYSMLENGIAYVAISAFGESTFIDFIVAREELLNQGMKAMIIDLRGNGGGYLEDAQSIAGDLLPAGSKMATYKIQGKTVETDIAKGSNAVKFPIVFICNQDTASASEYLVAALKYNGKATVVGTTSFGKGCAQNLFKTAAGDSFKLSTEYFCGPNGEAIDEVGIKPDYYAAETGGLTAAQAAELASAVVPFESGKKYTKKGSYGLNVLAAQQRLKQMGYKLETTGFLDEATMDVLKIIQKNHGGYVYGALDFATIKWVSEDYQSYLNTENTDAPLAKAIELLSKQLR